MTKSNKTYIVRCPHCDHRVFDADHADVEIKCPECRKVFGVKLEKKAG
jgi:phage FluMu protein Com